MENKDFYICAAVSLILIFSVVLIQLRKRYYSSNRFYSRAYQKKMLLTRNEWKNYMNIRQMMEREGLRIFPKVRLLDLVEPKKGFRQQYYTLLNKVQSKHVDFVICDNMLNVLLILELDDSSHDLPDRRDRDIFVDTILQGAGYQIIHSRNFQNELPVIQSAISKTRGRKNSH